MDIEARLENLKHEVTRAQRKGPIIRWPGEIKKEATSLARILGAHRVSIASTLNKSSIIYWMKTTEEIPEKIDKEVNFSVTRISAKYSGTEPKDLIKRKTIIATLNKHDAKFHIYSMELAMEVVERFLK